jgi:hypothetical protein
MLTIEDKVKELLESVNEIEETSKDLQHNISIKD